MAPKNLQDSEIARLVSNVTQTILGSKAVLATSTQDEPDHFVSLPLHGAPGFVVFMAMSEKGLTKMSAVMFGVTAESVDPSMRKDTLGEFANMAAGQIKAALEPGHVLGLPQAQAVQHALLRLARSVDLRVGEIPVRVYLVPQQEVASWS